MAHLRFQMNAGLLIRGQVKNALQKYCDWHGVGCNIREYKNWLESDFIVELDGPELLLRQIIQWAKDLEKDG